jgi:hypothetical protein
LTHPEQECLHLDSTNTAGSVRGPGFLPLCFYTSNIFNLQVARRSWQKIERFKIVFFDKIQGAAASRRNACRSEAASA